MYDVVHSRSCLATEDALPTYTHVYIHIHLYTHEHKVMWLWSQAQHLPVKSTVASYCFRPLHFTLQEHPTASWANGGATIRLTERPQTVLSMSKWTNAWVGRSTRETVPFNTVQV